MKKAPENEQRIIDRFCESIQSNWNLGPMRSHYLHSLPLTLTNPSKSTPLHISFSDCIFHFKPSSLTLKPRKSSTIQIYFYFCEAKIIVGKVEMSVNNEIRKIIKLSAIGKIPFLTLTKTKVNFGEVNLLRSKTDRIEIKNVSEVSVGFKIRRKEADCEKDVIHKNKGDEMAMLEYSQEQSKKKSDNHIIVSPTKGFLKPGESYQIMINYSPTIFDKHDFEEYAVETEENALTEEERNVKDLCVERWNSVAAKLKADNSNFKSSMPSKEYFYDMKDIQNITGNQVNFNLTHNGKIIF
jgi:uncharacterized cupredoxin-like copper-binding protein